MDKELIISTTDEGVQMALLEDKQLVELHKEAAGSKIQVGDIYVGKVRKIMPGLNAAFIDVGEDKDGFMHYLDLGLDYKSVDKYLRLAMNGAFAVGGANGKNTSPLKDFKIEPVMEKNGNLNDVLKVGQLVLTQVAKEPISTKGPKLTGDISFAGRYLVLTPFGNNVSISQKIKGKEERGRLRRLIQSIKPENFSIIVRTIAEGKDVAELDTDLRQLMNRWQSMTDRLKRIHGPQKLVSEIGATSALIRDALTDDFSTVYIDNEETYNEVRDYIASIAPDKADIVKHYKMETPIFEQFGVLRDIRRAFGRIVTIRSGVYLYVEHTEAMHVIDVNSGNRFKAGTGQEDTALQVNLESAKEIVRQMRLRDLGGIVIIDFVDMQKAEHRKQLYDYVCAEMKRDKARHTVLPLSKFGLMQITRQRVRPAVEVEVQEKCPLCEGTGTIKSSFMVVDEIESNLRYLSESQNEHRLTVVAHPYVYAYLTKGFLSIRRKWARQFHMRLAVKPSEQLSLLEYKFINAQGDEISL